MSGCALSEADQSSASSSDPLLCLYHTWFAYLTALQSTFYISHKGPVNLKPAPRPFNIFHLSSIFYLFFSPPRIVKMQHVQTGYRSLGDAQNLDQKAPENLDHLGREGWCRWSPDSFQLMLTAKQTQKLPQHQTATRNDQKWLHTGTLPCLKKTDINCWAVHSKKLSCLLNLLVWRRITWFVNKNYLLLD